MKRQSGETLITDYSSIGRRIQFYAEWYKDMNNTEKLSFIGEWVKERIKLFQQAINSDING